MTPDIDDLSNEDLGELLTRLRKRVNRRVEWMADQLRVDARTIRNWEAGRNRASMADVIAYETLTKCKLSDLPKTVSPCEQSEWVTILSLFDSMPFDLYAKAS